MPIIVWDESFSLGVQQFDDHHQYLIELLNKVYDDCTSEESSDSIGDVLEELVHYTIYHFSAEEYWMNENSYPGVADHTNKHDLFSSRITEMLKEYRTGKSDLTGDVLMFLNNWLISHILQSDADYGRFISAT